MDTILGWLSSFSQHLAPFDARGNPYIYPYILGAIGFSLLLTLIMIAQARFSASMIAGQAIALACDLLFIYLVWIGFSTPFDHLWFRGPSAGDLWWFLPADLTFATIAVLAHLLLILFAAFILAIFWFAYQIPFSINSVQGDLIITVGVRAVIVLLALGWMASGWPIWLAIPALVFAVYILANSLTEYLTTPLLRRLNSISVKAMRRVNLITLIAQDAFFIAGLLVILFIQDTQWPILTLLLLYLALTRLDRVVASFLMLWNPPPGDHEVASSRRWLLTVPLVLGVIFAGASGSLDLWHSNPSLTSSLWVEAGIAALAYMIFKPLTVLARYIAGALDKRPELDETLNRILPELLDVVKKSALGQRATSDGRRSAPASDTAPAPAITPISAPTADVAASSETPNVEESRVFQELRYPCGVVFFLLLLLYHWVIGHTELDTLLNTSLVPLGVGALTILAGIIQLVSNPVLRSTRSVFLMFMLVIALVTGVAELFTVLPAPTGVSALVAGQSISLASQIDLYAVTARLVQGLLCLLTLGQIYYLFVVISTTLKLEQAEIKTREDEEYITLGNWRNQYKQYAKATEAYEKATELNPTNIEPWLGKGYALESANRHRESLEAMDQVISMNPQSGAAWNGRANALLELENLSEAIDAEKQALALDPTNATYLANMGYILNQQGDFSAALDWSEQAIARDSAADFGWRVKAEALNGMGRPQQALVALEAAQRLQSKASGLWRVRGDVLTNLGQYREATSCYNRALKFDKGNTRALRGKENVARLMQGKDATPVAP